MIDPETIKNDFPLLSRKIHGKPFIYLDSGATSQKPKSVISAMSEFQMKHNANIHRGIYTLSEEATEMYEGVREHVARFIHARSSKEIIFTRNATESINLVALSWARQTLRPGDEIVTTEMEHHSNIVPWQLLAKAQGIALKFIPADPESGRLDLSRLDSIMTKKTALVCIGHMSNLLGTVNPVQTIVTAAHAVGAKVLVDGCQAVPHMPVDVQELQADFYAFSGHKMLGPTGVGVLWAKQEILEATEPLFGGGDMIKSVTKEQSTWNDIPWKFEAGTPNIVGVIGMGAAIEYLQELGMEQVWRHEQILSDYAIPRLKAVEGLRLFGIPEPSPDRGAIFSFWLDGIHPHDIATMFDEEGIAVRAGHMCAQPMLARFHRPAATRISCFVYSTTDDIDAAIVAIEKARTLFA